LKLKFLTSILLFILLIAILPNISNAHPGGRDELGGHFKVADCIYFLHSPTPLAESAKDINELITLIKQNNSNSKCVSNLSPNTIELEGFIFANSEPVATQPETSVATTPAPTPAPPSIELGKQYAATLDKCVDGDTANININGQVYKTRFLYIDTPEYTTEKEPFGKEASDFTCSFLGQGNITLETDGNELYDKYDRLLAWVWVGNKLHQEEIAKAGFVEDFYDYGDYKYEQNIIAAMDSAKSSYVGIYAADKPAETIEKQEETAENKDAVQTSANSDSDEGETTEVEKEVSKVASNLETPEEESVSDGYAITGLIISLLLFIIPSIKYSKGISPVIAHKLKARKWWINVILFFIYAAIWWLILIVIIVEIIHLLKNRNRFA
jgi:micrococcal nuclease